MRTHWGETAMGFLVLALAGLFLVYSLGVANAVAVTARLLEENLTERITADLARLGAENLRKSRSVANGGGE